MGEGLFEGKAILLKGNLKRNHVRRVGVHLEMFHGVAERQARSEKEQKENQPREADEPCFQKPHDAVNARG